jgi:glycosyltransferase involved in cell wall biosynthesis
VVVVTKRDDRRSAARDTLDGIPIYRVHPAGPRGGLRKWSMIPFAVLRMFALRRDFDLIYCPGYQGIGIAAILTGWLLGRSVVLRSGNLGVLAGTQWDAPLARWHIPKDAWPVRWLKRRLRNLYISADAIACNCRDNENEALAFQVPRARVHYLPNAVDVARFHEAAPADKQEIRRQMGWPADVFLWLYVGRLSTEKGVIDLVKAWREVSDDTATLVLVGPDMPGHALDAGPTIRQFVGDHGLQHRVIFHGESTDPAQLLRAADAYVQPSHYESFSNALVEAMATGLPVVASRVGGMLDCIIDGDNGLLCEPGQPDDLARKMRALRNDPALAARLGKHARATVVEHFDEATILKEFGDLFRSIGARRR